MLLRSTGSESSVRNKNSNSRSWGHMGRKHSHCCRTDQRFRWTGVYWSRTDKQSKGLNYEGYLALNKKKRFFLSPLIFFSFPLTNVCLYKPYIHTFKSWSPEWLDFNSCLYANAFSNEPTVNLFNDYFYFILLPVYSHLSWQWSRKRSKASKRELAIRVTQAAHFCDRRSKKLYFAS